MYRPRSRGRHHCLTLGLEEMAWLELGDRWRKALWRSIEETKGL